ncbi:MAG: sigma-54 dependent transcriptional regulator [Desulfobacterales bacterium]|nr:sigma-54 dependent transcriptional regulator [Pseudomonadota bacterium]MBU4355213.1 sigma-54 dependent transcriptional regulator [Pseudomonadota bacterium]MCG2771412.1 sigma-54 dependent transcriptional regulator [Desulfobacterales bacterium]
MITVDHRVVQGGDDPLDPGKIPEFTDIITADPHLTEILSWLPIYADSDLPIMLTGEPGTGKELVALAIFALGPVRRRSSQRLNCAALTESLASSELFGHLRGAFTGADHARPGKFRLAHGGSLFLDEVGELPLSIQPKLLRAVEQGEIEPVGGDAAVQVDVRLVAASNQDLLRLIAAGRFRQDLYDRLAVLAIHLPPLRQRPADILLLAGHFARETARRYGRDQSLQFSGAARRRLQKQPWPGNVRELKNVVTRAVLFSAGGLIREEDLAFTPYPASSPQSSRVGEWMPALRPSAAKLKELLDSEGGNVSALSRRLQVCSKTIYRWLRTYHIDLMGIREAEVT